MEELEQRIIALRQLLNGEREPAELSRRPVIDLRDGHRPAHAAPGPLLDDLTTPATVVRLEVEQDQEPTPLHAVGSAADRDELTRSQVAEVIRLQA